MPEENADLSRRLRRADRWWVDGETSRSLTARDAIEILGPLFRWSRFAAPKPVSDAEEFEIGLDDCWDSLGRRWPSEACRNIMSTVSWIALRRR